MLLSTHPGSALSCKAQGEEIKLKRRRFQKGCLQLMKRGGEKRWVVFYYDSDRKRRCHTIGIGKMTKTDAEKERDEFMRAINGIEEPEPGGTRPLLFSEFIEQTYLPFQRKKWKDSTAGTTENRIQHHIVKGIGANALDGFTLTRLQAFLQDKADA